MHYNERISLFLYCVLEVVFFMKKNKTRLLTIGILLTLATGIIHVINRIIFTSANIRDLLKASAQNYYQWRFGKIYYKKKGKGSPLLLIHDLSVYSSAYEWNQVIDQLAEDHTVYAVDLLGCGRSDKPSMTYTSYLYVQMISDFIKNVIHEKTDVIASGDSSSFAVLACNNEDHLFGKLILINPPSFAALSKMPGKRSKLYKLLLEIPVFGTLIYNMITCQSNVELLFTEKYLFNPFKISPELIDVYYESAHKGFSSSKYLLSSIVGRYINNSISHALKNINQSIVLLLGEHEENREEICDSYTNCNPAIESTVLASSKHLPHIETPEKFVETLKVYL